MCLGGGFWDREGGPRGGQGPAQHGEIGSATGLGVSSHLVLLVKLRDHGTLDIHRGRLRPPTETVMVTAHTVRTVHHTGSEDGPPTPGAGNVRTKRATCGTRAGAISTSTTAVPATAPGSPVRVRSTHATAKPISML